MRDYRVPESSKSRGDIMMMQLLKWIVAVCMGLGFALTANSQPFPHKLIKIMVPFAGGSGTDAVARITAQNLVESLKQPVIVENRPGANGVIATEFVASPRRTAIRCS